MELKGGDKLKAKLEEIAKSMGGGSVRVGFLEGAKYPDGTPVAAVAFWNEFGHAGRFPSPPRPFFRNMIAKESEGWATVMAAYAKKSNYNANVVLSGMGELIVAQLQESISDTESPELSETTKILRSIYGMNTGDIRARDVLAAQKLAKEGVTGVSGTGAHPLIWTGHMRASVKYEVRDEPAGNS